ncbi:iron-sulfur cluster insertion protein ErpA [Reinekea thalattae]|uniref:Iron-sulfur cluster insertion protein ErpA n=1 Tax=Reinekea thalattae TaxID=2593301 RepID=A0A5C8ZCK2_9GAMM|nr:iron-sulfur cluster insertion protein ErpA [Reinekea thalattae]TXR54901.1 iron-sulfur cluster insertion protein ErpA [Reinekea thalattae]
MTDAIVDVADPINISEAAIEKVRALVAEEGNDDLMLRVFVTGGGCAGFQYGFTFDDSIAEDDSLITKNDVRFLIDSLSVQYLGGSTVDYTQGLDGSRFVIHNPSASTTCGCGSSFAI